MIDWFASKLGLLVFVTGAFGSLLLFASTQAGAFGQFDRMQQAADLARVFDRLCEDCSITYRFGESRSLRVFEHGLVLEGMAQNFTATARPVILETGTLRLYKKGGIVHAQAP